MNPFVLSGFSDEICDPFEEQLQTVKELGMTHICLRSANGKNICAHTIDEVAHDLLPLLQAYGISVSSIGSPIGKVFINDAAAVREQIELAKKTVEIAHILSCRYVRLFSFYIPEGDTPAQWRDAVMNTMCEITEIFARGGIIALHENEKDIYGDTAARCLDLFQTVNSDAFRGIFDFANFVQCGSDPRADFDLLEDFIDYFHIKDAVFSTSDNVLCGTGDGKIAEILSLAKQHGFQGFLTLEPHLVLFSTLQSLELSDAEHVIKENLFEDGRAGFTAQLQALKNILSRLG